MAGLAERSGLGCGVEVPPALDDPHPVTSNAATRAAGNSNRTHYPFTARRGDFRVRVYRTDSTSQWPFLPFRRRSSKVLDILVQLFVLEGMALLARKAQQELPDTTIERISQNIRSMVDDRVERGIDLSRTMRCDSCGQEKSPAGSSLYGAYKLCNECLIDLTVTLASGGADTVVDFMTRHVDGSGSPVLGDDRDLTNIPRNSLQGRDKFMPSNEPA